MNTKSIIKTFLWVIIGILLYFVMEMIIGEVVNANSKVNEEGNDDMFPFYWLVFIIGGIIASTLSYVSWRKYKGEQKEKGRQDTD